MYVGVILSPMPRDVKSDKSGNRRTFLRTVGAAGAVALAGCAGGGGGSGDGDEGGDGGDGGDTETDAGGTATDAGAADAGITLGALYPLTGPYGGLAQLMRQGNNLAVAQLNENGGINGNEIEIVGEDTQADPQTGNQKARKLVEEDDADALFGAISSAVGAAVADYAAEVDVPYYPVVAADQITGENCLRTTFRYTTRATQMATSGAPWAVDRFGTNFWIHNADYLWGNSVAEAWEREARNAADSINVVGSTTSQLGASDFSSYISEIAASDAEWVLTGLNGGDAVNFLKQAQSYGLKSNTTIVSPVNSFQFIRRAAGEAAIGTFASIRYFEGFDSEVNQQFVSDFTDMHGSAPDSFAQDGWTNIRMYALAAEQAGSTDTDAIIDAQPDIDFEAPMGPTRYRECDHQAIHPVSIGEIVEPAGYEWPSMDVLETVSSEDAIQPCSEVACEF